MLTTSLFMSSFILSWNCKEQNQYSDSITRPTIDMSLEFNFTYTCHIWGMSPFPVFMVTETHTLQPSWCIAKIVPGAHRLKILLKISVEFPSPDTSADAVFCFVPVHYSKTPSAFLQLVLLNACARRGCALALSMNRLRQRAFIEQRKAWIRGTVLFCKGN